MKGSLGYESVYMPINRVVTFASLRLVAIATVNDYCSTTRFNTEFSIKSRVIYHGVLLEFVSP